MVISADAPPKKRPPRSRSALFTFAGLLAVVLVVAGLTAGGYQLWGTVRPEDTGGALDTVAPADESTTTSSTLPPTTVVRGVITAVHIEGAQYAPLAMPLEVVTPERGEGAGATFDGVLVDDQLATIEWDAGRPLALSGTDGSVVLASGVTVDLTPEGVVITLDGPVHGFVPASYRINTPVAVGTAGIAEPVDRVDFDATEESTVTFRGGSSTTVDVATIAIAATGAVVIEGTLTVERPDGQVTATRVAIAGGTSQLTFVLQADGSITLDATLGGTADVTP